MKVNLFIVATPIGNLDDITTRALQVLGEVDFVIAEDTRHTGELLARIGVKKPMVSFRDAPSQVMDKALREILAKFAAGKSAAYCTDAGTPGISDPGWRLINAALAGNVAIVAIPGPSALATILSLSDMPLDEFRFVGFLPKKKGNQTKINDLVDYLRHKESRGVIIYESPNRIRKTLNNFATVDADLTATIGRELTKKFETVYRGRLTSDFIDGLPEKGEYVILLHRH